MDANSDPNLLPSQIFTTAAALLSAVDQRVVVSLRDGRKLFGVLRSFDQFANLVIQDTMERIYINNSTFGETYRGVFIVRGENVVFLGELDPDREELIEDMVVESSVEDADIKDTTPNNFGMTSAITHQSSERPQVLRKIPFKDAERIFKERNAASKKVFKERSKKINLGENKDNYENHLY